MMDCHSTLSTARPAVFFDRDGVLNKDVNYLYKIEDFCWIAGAKEAIKYYNTKEYYVFVVTNQSGVARGYYNEDDVKKLHDWMQTELAMMGAHIDDFFHCPHHVEGVVDKYKRDCECRKPAPGLIFQAFKKWSVDKNKSFLIGDKLSDLEAANAAGIKGYLFDSSNLFEFIKNISAEGNL